MVNCPAQFSSFTPCHKSIMGAGSSCTVSHGHTELPLPLCNLFTLSVTLYEQLVGHDLTRTMPYGVAGPVVVVHGLRISATHYQQCK